MSSWTSEVPLKVFLWHLHWQSPKQHKTRIQNRHSHYRDSADEWILQRSSFAPLRVFAYEYHLDREKKRILRHYETVHFWQYFYIVLCGHYSSRQGEGERESWPLDNVGGHYHIKRWLTGTKGFSLLQKKSIGYWKSDNTPLCKCTLQAKKHFPIRVKYAVQLYIASLSLFQRER